MPRCDNSTDGRAQNGILLKRLDGALGILKLNLSLLELLARHPDVVTHRYRDFPPVLVPWMWNRFLDHATRRDPEATERAHGDRIMITPESPEAFEEAVWMAFFADAHEPARSAVLDEGTRRPDFEEFYRNHVRKLLLLRGGRRYVAKGNYNVTRLGYLLKLFPDARFVIPVRDPLWHVASLMKQHQLFCREEEQNPRVLRHMRRSGHFEFGLGRRVINTGDEPLQVYTIYAPVHHASGIVHETADDSERDEESGEDEPPSWTEQPGSGEPDQTA